MIEHYYRFLQQVYFIINIKILSIELNLAFEMFFKAINNLMSLYKPVFTLLAFGVYLKMTKLDASFLLITPYAIAIKKTISKI